MSLLGINSEIRSQNNYINIIDKKLGKCLPRT